MNKSLETLKNDPEAKELRKSVREGIEKAVQVATELAEERAAIQTEEDLTADIQSFFLFFFRYTICSSFSISL